METFNEETGRDKKISLFEGVVEIFELLED
jgi:hypothetical protein